MLAAAMEALADFAWLGVAAFFVWAWRAAR